MVRLNNRVISEGQIVCDAGQISIDFAPFDLVDGRNILEFLVDRGQYTLEKIYVEEILGGMKIPGYFFTLQVNDIQRILGGAHVLLDLKFLDDGLRKVGTIYVN